MKDQLHEHLISMKLNTAKNQTGGLSSKLLRFQEGRQTTDVIIEGTNIRNRRQTTLTTTYKGKLCAGIALNVQNHLTMPYGK